MYFLCVKHGSCFLTFSITFCVFRFLLTCLLDLPAGCGVVPSKYAHLADWTSSKDPYQADGHYFHELSELMPRTYFIEKVIYVYSGGNMGRMFDCCIERRPTVQLDPLGHEQKPTCRP